MGNTEFTRTSREAKAIAAALKCPKGHPLNELAVKLVRQALKLNTRRQAAAVLGAHETYLSLLLRRHPELLRL